MCGTNDIKTLMWNKFQCQHEIWGVWIEWGEISFDNWIRKHTGINHFKFQSHNKTAQGTLRDMSKENLQH